MTTANILPRLSWPAAIALHLIPGVLLLAFYLIAAPSLQRAGLPPVWGLLLGVLLVIVPVELGILACAWRRDALGQTVSAFTGLGRLDWKSTSIAGAASIAAGGMVSWLEPILRRAAFDWLPPWWSTAPGDLSTTTIALWILGPVLIGPMVEELYFRGWLLPRLPGGRWAAMVSGSALFAMYHLWQPYAWLTVFAVALPLAWARTRAGTTVSIVVHCSMNALAFAALLAGSLHR
jgi:uncharacterized protein